MIRLYSKKFPAFFELQKPGSIYTVNEEQKKAINEAQEQIRNNQTLADEEATKDIDEWLK